MKKVNKIVLIALLLYSSTPLLPLRAQLLYEVSGNSAKAKSYIFATNRYVDVSYFDSIYHPTSQHPNSLTPLELAVRSFYECDRVVTEFVIQDYEALATLRQAAILPDSLSASQPLSLSTLFSPKDYEYIKDACQLLLGLNIDSVGLLKPSYLTALYRDELMRRHIGLDEELSIATFFEAFANQTNIPVYGLDNASETMYIAFDREPLAWQCQELKRVIDYPEREVAQERIIREMYLTGRLMDIVYQVEGPDNETSISYSDYKVFCQRNIQWAKRLTPYFKDGRAFVTLDALYLGGDKGLLAQLKAQGFRVRPVNRRIKIK